MPTSDRRGGAKFPTAPADAARIGVWQPSLRPVMLTGEWIETSWGRARIIGRLGQRHACVIEAVQYTALQKSPERDTGRVRLLVDPYRVRMKCGGGEHYNGARLVKLMDELSTAQVEFETPTCRGKGHIIDLWARSKRTAPDPRTGGERPLWRVILGSPWVAMHGHLMLWHDPEPIAAIDSGVAQAIARLMLGHNQGARYHLDTALAAVGVAPGRIRDARAAVRACAAQLAAVGVAMDGDFLVTAASSTVPDVLPDPAKASSTVPAASSSVPGPSSSVPGPSSSVPGPIDSIDHIGSIGRVPPPPNGRGGTGHTDDGGSAPFPPAERGVSAAGPAEALSSGPGPAAGVGAVEGA
ncbi:MAG: hypothetical protein QJR02_14270 [Sinobacteraceae bacterium]|nr:hypothetical protein [Nevskiaceae bacterium]